MALSIQFLQQTFQNRYGIAEGCLIRFHVRAIALSMYLMMELLLLVQQIFNLLLQGPTQLMKLQLPTNLLKSATRQKTLRFLIKRQM